MLVTNGDFFRDRSGISGKKIKKKKRKKERKKKKEDKKQIITIWG